MREQLGHLLEKTESPHITLQVLPFGTGAAKYERLRADALSPEDSIALVRKAIEELSR